MVMFLHNLWALHLLSRVYSKGCSSPGANCTGTLSPSESHFLPLLDILLSLFLVMFSVYYLLPRTCELWEGLSSPVSPVPKIGHGTSYALGNIKERQKEWGSEHIMVGNRWGHSSPHTAVSRGEEMCTLRNCASLACDQSSPIDWGSWICLC